MPHCMYMIVQFFSRCATQVLMQANIGLLRVLVLSHISNTIHKWLPLLGTIPKLVFAAASPDQITCDVSERVSLTQ